jgi:hypothetical protein
MSKATYTVYSAEVADLLLDPEDLEAYEDLHGERGAARRIEEAAGTYADALRDAFRAAGLDVEVEVVHRTTGGRTVQADNAAEEVRIQDVANETLEEMERLEDVRQAMAEHDQAAAPGSTSDQWHWFVEDARQQYLVLGNDQDEAPVTVVTPEFAHYWHAIARGDYATAEQYGEVPEEWREK